MTPRGIRNNNPGNIRHSRTMWQGEAAQQPDPDFVTFASATWGLRAVAKILVTYANRGLTTVEQIITRWAPPNENDTKAYIAAVAQSVGVNATSPLNLQNPGLLAKLVKAIVRHENGEQPYSDDDVGLGVNLALGRVQA